jgi:hypothetical protein
MRPAILQWKVALALLGVVAVAVILGSALGPAAENRANVRVFYTAGLNSPQTSRGVRSLLKLMYASTPAGGNGTQVGGWTGYAVPPTSKVRQVICRELRRSEGPVRSLPSFCDKHARGRG